MNYDDWDGTPTCQNWGHTSAPMTARPNCGCRMCLRSKGEHNSPKTRK